MVSREKLDQLFKPKSFALIGASDKSTFSRLLVDNLRTAGHGERIYLINPRSSIVHGQETLAECADLPKPIDLAFIMLPAARVPAALRDASLADIKAAVILSSGYSETGSDCVERQQHLTDLAQKLDITILGPNVLGYINVLDNVPAMTLSDPPKRAGHVALISQSGASCAAMKDFAEMSGVDLSHVITVGNEAAVTIADIMNYLVHDDRVKALAIFIESIKKPELFTEVAEQAALMGKPIVVLKAGKSELAARAAASHTGALVGDDRVIGAMLEHLGVIRVDTVEDMLITAGIGAHTGPLPAGGIGVASISGGACDVVADLADGINLELPQFTSGTIERLRKVMPDFGHAQNPLDVTGAALATPGLWTNSIKAIASDPGVAVTLVVNSLPWREDGKPFYGEAYVKEIGEALSDASTPGVYVTQVTQPIGGHTRELLERTQVPHTVTGLRGAIYGIAKIIDWSNHLRELSSHSPSERPSPTELPTDARTLNEADARALFEKYGVPFVPAVIARTGREAEHAAIAWPETKSVIKIVSPDIPHKSDVGGVLLDVDHTEIAGKTEQMMRDVQDYEPQARIEGVLVSPMRQAATELIVGVTRDEDWGLMLAVGIGGVLVEVLDDVALAPLPVDTRTVVKMLDKLRGRQLLDGVRGRPAADIPRVADVIVRAADAAVAMGDHLETAEINPLRIEGARVEALDALIILRSADTKERELKLDMIPGD